MGDEITRDAYGRFAKLVCVNAHDRCYEGVPCRWCEIKIHPRDEARITRERSFSGDDD